MTTFDITKCPVIDGYKRCKTRDGRDVRILCEDINYDQPIVAAVKQPNGIELTRSFTRDGYYYASRNVHDSDLVNIPRKIKVERWINVYRMRQLNVVELRNLQVRLQAASPASTLSLRLRKERGYDK